MGLPHYAVELDALTFQGAQAHPKVCPVCTKKGRWVGATFVPDNERAKGYPTCYCRRCHEAGAYAYDPETKQFLKRES
jgi:hypothetical protein